MTNFNQPPAIDSKLQVRKVKVGPSVFFQSRALTKGEQSFRRTKLINKQNETSYINIARNCSSHFSNHSTERCDGHPRRL